MEPRSEAGRRLREEIAGLILGLPEPTPSDGEVGRWYVEGWRAMRRDLLDHLASEDRAWLGLTPTANAMESGAGGASSPTVKTTTTSDAALAASPTAPGLDVAWAEAEAALPEGTWIGSLTKGDRWHAQAFSRTTVPFGRRRTASASDETPAAALLALAAALRGPVR